jgi:outer membrane biosynthesis protein TonB
MLRLPRWHANVGPLWFRPDELTLVADADLRAPLADATYGDRPVAFAFGASVAVHAALAAMVALVIGGTGVGRQSPPDATLRATLATPAQKFVAPEPVAAPPPPVPTSAVADAAPPKALVPTPIPAPKPPPVKDSGEGRVFVQVVESDVPLAPELLGSLGALHPGAVRIVPEFEVEPAGTYPEAALAERRQLSAEILAVVHEDGSLEVVQGTFEDPIFRDSVRAAVAAAKARPPEVDGKVVTGWTLLRFYFEFVGSAAAGTASAPTR